MYLYLPIMLFLLLISFIIGKTKTKYRKLLIICNTFGCLVYIIWRLTAIPLHNGIISFTLGVILYLAEILGMIAFFNFQFLFIGKYELEKKTLDDLNGNIPFVDILICTYNEPLYLLELTIAAATNLEYPADKFMVHICDDGRRDELKALCEDYGINYITREDNKGAKAGNINNALQVIKGDLFAVLDADMIPKKDFLKQTIGYFCNENLAFVQTPQVYYNQDMYQYNLSGKPLPNEQDFFMRDIQEARASRNAVLHVGTNAIFRRSFVLEIGGYPTCSITEDMAVGMCLQAEGYDSILVNDELVFGLSATTFVELVKQRDRWCRGNLQVLKHYNPIFTSGLTFGQKIAYLDGAVYWFSNLQKLIYMIWPLIYLLTGTLILDCTLKELLTAYIPFIVGQILIFNTLSPKTRSLKWSHYYEIAMAPHLCMSILKEMLSLKTKFNVTSKDLTLDKKSFQSRIVLPHIFVAILTVLGWIVSTIDVLHHNAHIGAYLLNVFWSAYNLSGIVIAIKAAYQKPLFRKTERIFMKDDLEVAIKANETSFKGIMLDISGQGTQLKLEENVHFEPNSLVYLIIGDTEYPCEVVRSSKNLLALQFVHLSPPLMKAMMEIFTENLTTHYNVKKKQEYYQATNHLSKEENTFHTSQNTSNSF